MRILITGADGFVGRHAAAAFRKAGHAVIEAQGPTAASQRLDITSPTSTADAVRAANPDAVLHLAGASSVALSHEQPLQAFQVNTLGTVNLLEAVRRHAPRARFLHVSSGEVYGALTPSVQANEETPRLPTSPYGASKMAAEDAVDQFRRGYGVQSLVVRPFNHLGAGQASHFVVPSFAAQLVAIARGASEPTLHVGNLEPVRDFLHVEDVVSAYALLLERGSPGVTYNICSGVPRRIRDVLDELIRLSGVKVAVEVDPARLRPAEIPWLVGDATRLKALGWAPTRTLAHALEDVLREVQGR